MPPKKKPRIQGQQTLGAFLQLESQPEPEATTASTLKTMESSSGIQLLVSTIPRRVQTAFSGFKEGS